MLVAAKRGLAQLVCDAHTCVCVCRVQPMCGQLLEVQRCAKSARERAASVLLGAWWLVLAAWCLVLGAWCLVLGLHGTPEHQRCSFFALSWIPTLLSITSPVRDVRCRQ